MDIFPVVDYKCHGGLAFGRLAIKSVSTLITSLNCYYCSNYRLRSC